MSNKGGLMQHKSSRTSKSTKAGLIFSIGRIARFLKIGWYSNRVGAGAPVYLGAVLEYLTTEVVELVGNAVRDLKKKKKRIKLHHIQIVVKNDSELDKMFRNVIIPNANVIPRIHKSLLTWKKKDGEGNENTPTN